MARGQAGGPNCREATLDVCELPPPPLSGDTWGELAGSGRQASRISAGLPVLQEAFLDHPCPQQASSVVV